MEVTDSDREVSLAVSTDYHAHSQHGPLSLPCCCCVRQHLPPSQVCGWSTSSCSHCLLAADPLHTLLQGPSQPACDPLRQLCVAATSLEAAALKAELNPAAGQPSSHGPNSHTLEAKQGQWLHCCL